jgi:hypothetical protein
VTRALALGAIGALMSLFANSLAEPQHRSSINLQVMSRIWIAMSMGAIVAVVVTLGLFHTRQISIFTHTTEE